MGASDVVGFGATEPAKDGWAPVLASLLPGRTVLTKLGAIGRLVKTIKERSLPEAIALKPHMVVLWTGVNDFNAGVSPEDFENDLDGLLAGLATTGAAVYVVNLPAIDRLPAFKGNAEAIRQALPAWQAAVRTQGARHGASVVELTAYSGEIDTHPEYIFADGFHPTSIGYRRLAEIIRTALKP